MSNDDHEFEIIRDEQRGRGWHLSWRCKSKSCDARGNSTVPRRETALKLFSIVAEGHRTMLAEADRAGS